MKTEPENAVASHTPGPWHRNIRAGGKYPVVFAGRNQHVATVCQQRDGAETEANIDLIAAAPRMYEALARIAAFDPKQWDAATLGNIAREALAKATGA